MINYKIYISFLILVLLGAGSLAAVRLGYYPIVIVNNHLVTAKDFDENFRAASVYYQNILTSYGKNAALKEKVKINENPKPEEIQAAVLSGLIENILVGDEVKKEFGSGLNEAVGEKIKRALRGADIQAAAQSLYSLSAADFRERILEPQAKKDLLSAKLAENGQSLDEWLAQAKKSARVVILVPGFSWDGKSVAVK